MNTTQLLWQAAAPANKRALPILSFPAAQKIGVNVNELVHSAQLQADAMTYVAQHTPTAAAVSLMDLSVEAGQEPRARPPRASGRHRAVFPGGPADGCD